VYTGAGDIDSLNWNVGWNGGWNGGMTFGVELDFRSLNQITIIAAAASATAMMEPITIPARAPIGKALIFPLLCAIGEGSSVVAIKLGRASSDFVGVSVLLGVVMGIGPFVGWFRLHTAPMMGFWW
jgi:hypothetical protein